jgi:hypothetical protein
MSIETENEQLRAQLAELKRKVDTLRRPASYAEKDAIAAAQLRADSIAQLFGTRAAPPLTGENPMRYRARLLNRFKQHSPRFQDEHFDHYSEAAMGVAEDVIFADASRAARGDLNNGGLVPVESRDAAGRLITKFAGDPLSWMTAFMGNGARGFINRPTPGKQ